MFHLFTPCSLPHHLVFVSLSSTTVYERYYNEVNLINFSEEGDKLLCLPLFDKPTAVEAILLMKCRKFYSKLAPASKTQQSQQVNFHHKNTLNTIFLFIEGAQYPYMLFSGSSYTCKETLCTDILAFLSST